MIFSKWVVVVLKWTVGFKLMFWSVCSDRFLENVELWCCMLPYVEMKPTFGFRTTPTHLEFIMTWCYRKPHYTEFPPCKVSNPTHLEFIMTWCYRKPHYTKFPPCKVSNPTHLEFIMTWCYRKPYYIVFPPCKVSNPTH